MDFKVTLDNINDGITNCSKISEDVDKNINKVIETIQKLTDESWNGLASQGCAVQFECWINDIMSLLDTINEFRDALKESAPKIEKLLKEGKSLQI